MIHGIQHSAWSLRCFAVGEKSAITNLTLLAKAIVVTPAMPGKTLSWGDGSDSESVKNVKLFPEFAREAYRFDASTRRTEAEPPVLTGQNFCPSMYYRYFYAIFVNVCQIMILMMIS